MSSRPLSADRELADLSARSTVALNQTITDLIAVAVERTDNAEILAKLREQLSQVLAMSSLLGRRRVLLQVAAKLRTHKLTAVCDRSSLDESLLAASPNPLIPAIPFAQAINDILKRYPVLAIGYRNVQKAYARGHAFALAKSTDLILTRKVQDTLVKAISQGGPRYKTEDTIAALGDWSRSYTEVVYTTNTTTAYAAGVVAQAYDPDIEEVCPAMKFMGNAGPPSDLACTALVGLVAATKDPIWNRYLPPIHYRCGHTIGLEDRWELKKRGLLNKDGSVKRYLPQGYQRGGPEPGFRSGQVARRLGFALSRGQTIRMVSR